jgi:hypothetical protein
LPASQNHHHSNSGGFLLHTLEVVEIAIKRRNAKMLPIGANVEAQNEKKDLCGGGFDLLANFAPKSQVALSNKDRVF